MPNIILDLRECTAEQKQLVLRVMETMEYMWACSKVATSPPLPVSSFNYLFMNDRDRKYLLYGNYQSTEEISNIESYDYVISDVSLWLSQAEVMEERERYIDDLLS